MDPRRSIYFPKDFGHFLAGQTHTMKRDGTMNHCPICRAALSAPSSSHGGTNCPQCEAQLWHLPLPSGPAFFVRRQEESIYDLMAAIADPSHRFTADDLKAALKDADSLDTVEFFTELEDGLSGKGK